MGRVRICVVVVAMVGVVVGAMVGVVVGAMVGVGGKITSHQST